MASPADQPPDERRPSPRCRKTPQPDTVAVSTVRACTRWSTPVTIASTGPLSPGRAAAGTPASVTTGPRPWGKTRVPGGSGEKTDEAHSPTPDAISPCHTDTTPGFRESPVGVTDWALHRMDKLACSRPGHACRTSGVAGARHKCPAASGGFSRLPPCCRAVPCPGRRTSPHQARSRRRRCG